MARDRNYIKLLIRQTKRYLTSQTKPLFEDQIKRLELQEKALASKPNHRPNKKNK